MRMNIRVVCLGSLLSSKKERVKHKVQSLFHDLCWRLCVCARVREWEVKKKCESGCEKFFRKSKGKSLQHFAKMQKKIQKVTQCGTLTTFFFVFIIVFSLSSSALTTFGVNKQQNNPLPATPARNRSSLSCCTFLRKFSKETFINAWYPENVVRCIEFFEIQCVLLFRFIPTTVRELNAEHFRSFFVVFH